ncbi:MAG: MinD/ParA family protein [Mycobacterium sp.]|nr:MinD/ParA family protein [Mycobacterium sp.]
MFGDRPLPPVPAEASQPPGSHFRGAQRHGASPGVRRDAAATGRMPPAASPPRDTGSGAEREPPQWSGDSQLTARQLDRMQSSQGQPAQQNWSYVERIRSSELVPTRKIPPRRGWRYALYKATFGLINPGQSPDERQLAALEAKVRTRLRGRYKIGVLGKGGTGKTTIAAGVGSIFAQLRQEDLVVAIDADTAFGKLGSRIDPHAAGSYWELTADRHVHSFADIRSLVGNNTVGLFVLAGEQATAHRRVLDAAVYREAATRLDDHFTISIVDCGSSVDSQVTQEVLRDMAALIVVSSPWFDGASAAAQILEWLANHELSGVLRRTVVVLNDSDGHADRRTRSVLLERFGSRGQVVIELPFDPRLRPGGVIDVDHDIARTTRRRLIEIAAAIAEHFVATTDGPT